MSVRVAVLGVGNRLRGDDAIGPRVIDELREKTAAVLFDCGTAPENFIGPVVEARPERILFIDACAFGAGPGEFRFFDREQIDELAAGLVSTHTLPLSMTVALLGQELRATESVLGSAAGPNRPEMALLGVQPRRLEFGEELSAELTAALPLLVRAVCDWVGP
jgi:hydrogenase 3 maturation protease